MRAFAWLLIFGVMGTVRVSHATRSSADLLKILTNSAPSKTAKEIHEETGKITGSAARSNASSNSPINNPATSKAPDYSAAINSAAQTMMENATQDAPPVVDEPGIGFTNESGVYDDKQIKQFNSESFDASGLSTGIPPNGIAAIVEASGCQKSDHHKKYAEGMAMAFANTECRSQGDPLALQLQSLVSSPAGSNDNDTLKKYFGSSANGHASIATYSILLSLGLRESNGKAQEAGDTTASSKRGGSQVEAGLFQVSSNSLGLGSMLRDIYESYRSQLGQPSCLKSNFPEGSASRSDNFTGGDTTEAKEFRKLMKECPAFATDYTAALIRITYKHNGPLIRNEAKVIPQCTNMFNMVQEYVRKKAPPNFCSIFRQETYVQEGPANHGQPI